MSKDINDLIDESELDGTFPSDDGLTTQRDKTWGSEDVIAETYAMFQSKYNHTSGDQKAHDEHWDVATEDGDMFRRRHSTDPVIMPSNTIRDLKYKNPDYRSGPVKTYTAEEIDDYVQHRKTQE